MLSTFEHRLYHLLAPGNGLPRPLRWLLIIGYTALMTLLLEQSSAQPVVGPVAPKTFDPLWDALLTGCHFVGFGVLVILLWSALPVPQHVRRALVLAVGFALIFGLVTEIVQTLVPDRSSSWSDLLVNWGVTLAVALWINHRSTVEPADSPQRILSSSLSN